MARLRVMTQLLGGCESCFHFCHAPHIRYSTILSIQVHCIVTHPLEPLPNMLTMTPASSRDDPRVLKAVALCKSSPYWFIFDQTAYPMYRSMWNDSIYWFTLNESMYRSMLDWPVLEPCSESMCLSMLDVSIRQSIFYVDPCSMDSNSNLFIQWIDIFLRLFSIQWSIHLVNSTQFLVLKGRTWQYQYLFILRGGHVVTFQGWSVSSLDKMRKPAAACGPFLPTHHWLC